MPDPVENIDRMLSAHAAQRLLHWGRARYRQAITEGLRVDRDGRTCLRWIREHQDRDAEAQRPKPEAKPAPAYDPFAMSDKINKIMSNAVRS